MQTSLRDKTLALLRERVNNNETTFAEVASETGLAKTWLERFFRNHSQKADVNYVQTLYEHLTGNKLEV